MPLGKEVGLGPGHIVLDGHPAPTAAQFPLSAHAYMWPNGRPSQHSAQDDGKRFTATFRAGVILRTRTELRGL